MDSSDGKLIIDSEAMKDMFHCDAYVIDVNEPGFDIVNLTRYWFGLFSHQRVTSAWKGMILVEIDAQQDNEARNIISPAVTLVTA